MSGKLFCIGADGSIQGELPLGYCAEVRSHAAGRELVLLESDACAQPMTYSVRLIDSVTMGEIARRDVPVRPMYAGFPGRSIAGCISPSGRYVYFLRSGPVIREGDDLVFRLTPVRWDRTTDELEVASFHVDSCHVDYGMTGSGDEDLFLHLGCEYASTIAFGSFSSSESILLALESLPRRTHGPLETNGSWLDSGRGYLYCVNRQGLIYEVLLRRKTFRLLASLPLGRDTAVPVHQITGAAGVVHVGVARHAGDMGLGMVTEVWSVSTETGEFLGRRVLPHAVVNFVIAPDGREMAGVNPYSRVVFCMDCETGEEVWTIRGLGKTPAEIVLAFG